VTQMVNLLSVRMELGAPMICMFLLDNPDHYASHNFKPFHWSRYNGRMFGLSRVYDYIYRPSELENMSLYDWIRKCERVRIPKSNKNYRLEKDLCDIEVEEYGHEFEYSSDPDSDMSEDEIDTDTEPQHKKNVFHQEMDENSLPTPAAKTNLSRNLFPFVHGHPLADSHAIELSTEDKEIVPNFIGPGLPRRDKGDWEYYCMTMLVFFRPWHSGKDLKQVNESWDESFLNYKFTERSCDIMNTFQLRYQCLDSRDDFRAQRNRATLSDAILES
ncbi:hypothetical protein K435DRAFT_587196, partial [Dendrothele bispora CBS 962.96]